MVPPTIPDTEAVTHMAALTGAPTTGLMDMIG